MTMVMIFYDDNDGDDCNACGCCWLPRPADMAVSTAGRTAPEVLARTIGVLGRMGFSDEMVFDELARSLMPGVHRLDPQQMHEMVSTVLSSRVNRPCSIQQPYK